MPFVHITIAGRKIGENDIRHLQEEATKLMVTLMRKRAEATAVLVEQAELSGWAVGGKPLTVAGHIEVKITEGTNTAEERQRFVEAGHALLKSVLGPELSAATYVVVHVIAPGDYGYGGLTQEQRKLAAAAA